MKNIIFSVFIKRAFAFLLSILILISVGITVLAESQAQTFSMDNSAIEYLGRWDINDGKAYGYFQSSLRFSFTGTSCTLNFESGGNIAAKIDNGDMTAYTSAESITVASALSNTVHTAEIHLISKGQFPVISGITLDADGHLSVAPKKTKIEFIGDSITEGFIDSANNTVDKTFGFLAAEQLGFAHNSLGYGGITLLPNYGSDTLGMVNRYFKIGEKGSPDIDWDTSKHTPDYIVINLGTNDPANINAAYFTSIYINFIKKLRTCYPDATIIVMQPFNGDYATEVEHTVRTIRNDGDLNTYLYYSANRVSSTQTSDGLHPNVQAHREIATELAAFITKLLNGETVTQPTESESYQDILSGDIGKVITFPNNVFGEVHHSTEAGSTSTDSVVFYGKGDAYGMPLKLTDLENGYYVFTADVKSSGGQGGKVNIGVNSGTTSTTQKVVNVADYTEWTTIRVMSQVTDNYLYMGLVWYGANSADTCVHLDSLKLEKVELLDQNGPDRSTSVTYITDKSIYITRAANQSGIYKQTVQYLEPFTEYTIYIPIKSDYVSGNMGFRVYNSFNTADYSANTMISQQQTIPYTDTNDQWVIREVNLTTGLSGVVRIDFWVNNSAGSAPITVAVDGLCAIKRSSNPQKFIPNKTYRSSDSRAVYSTGGFVSGTELTFTGNQSGYLFAPQYKGLTNGMYIFSAYVQSDSQVNFEIQGYDGSVTGTRYSVSESVCADEGWKYVSVQFYVTGNTAAVGFWWAGSENGKQLSFDGVRLQKLEEISLDQTFKWYKNNDDKRFPNSDKELKEVSGNSGSVEGVMRDSDGNILYLEPNTDYIMYLTYKSAVGNANWALKTYDTETTAYWDDCIETIQVSMPATDGKWKTSQIRITTGDVGMVYLFFYFSAADAGIRYYDGISYCKATPVIEAVTKEAEIDKEGVYAVTDSATGIIKHLKLTALVRGDATGNGTTDILDLIRLKKYFADKSTVISLKACLITGGTTVTTNDLAGLKKILMGL